MIGLQPHAKKVRLLSSVFLLLLMFSFAQAASDTSCMEVATCCDGMCYTDSCCTGTPIGECHPAAEEGPGCGPPAEVVPICGDGVCESGETCSTCSDDCGVCAPEPISAVCGQNDNTGWWDSEYTWDMYNYPGLNSIDFCQQGVLSFMPTFPEPGSTQEWYCQGMYGGSGATCGATRENCPEGMVVDGGTCVIDYVWAQVGWGECDVECGQGMQNAMYECQHPDGTIVADSYCEQPKPSSSRSCNLDCQDDNACSEGTCIEPTMATSVGVDGSQIFEGETIDSCNPEIIAFCETIPSGLSTTAEITGSCSGMNPWLCETDTNYEVTCSFDNQNYDYNDSLSFVIRPEPSEISGTIIDANDNVLDKMQLMVEMFKDGELLDSSVETDGTFTFSIEEPGEYVIRVSAENFDLSAQSTLISCGEDETVNISLLLLSCNSDCTSGYGFCNYDCLGDGCSLDESFFNEYANNLNSEYGTSITGEYLQAELQNRCNGAAPNARRPVPDYPGHYFVCCGSADSDDPIQEFGTIPVTVDSDARHLVSFTKIVNYGGLPVKMNVFVKSD